MLEFQASQNYMNSGLWYIFIINLVADNPEIFFHSISSDLSVFKKETFDMKYFLINYKTHLGKVVNMF